MEPNQTVDTPSMTPVAPVTPEAPKAIDLFKDGWSFTKANKEFTYGYIVVLTLLAVCTSEFVIKLSIENSVLMLLIGLGSFILSIISALIAWGLIRVVLHPTEALTLQTAVQWSLKHFLLLAWTVIVSMVCVLAGLILLIIPGIIISGYVYFSIYAVADEKGGGIKAMKYSYQLVKNRWIPTFAKLFLLGLYSFLIMLGVGIVVGIISALTGDMHSFVYGVGDILIQGIVGGALTIVGIHAMGKYYRYLQSTLAQPQ